MFIEKPATAYSIAKRKPVFGVGINDANYRTHYKNSFGKKVRCQFYVKWADMIKRCYSSKCHKELPTYIGCSVCDEWLTFSNFKSWMIKQSFTGKHLDKDILVAGNKVYSPDACLFVDSAINQLIVIKNPLRSNCPQGVCFYKAYSNFRAQCNLFGKNKHIGYFHTKEEASKAYKQFKSKHILEVAEEYKDEPRLYEALQNHAKLMLLQSD